MLRTRARLPWRAKRLQACQNNNNPALIRLLILMEPPCYGNFEKQSTAPKQPLVTIPPHTTVMPTFLAQNPQPSSTTPNISVLEVADPREPLTPSLETTYATPPQAAVGAPIDMAGKPSRTAIPHLARSIPLRLDDLCINTLPLCYRQHQSIPPGME